MTTEPLDTESLLADMQSDDPAKRRAVLDALAQSNAPSTEILRAFERVALHDAETELRQAALQALVTPAFRAAHATLAGTNPGGRQFMQAEIEKLEADSLLTPDQAAVLRGRYALPNAAGPTLRSTPTHTHRVIPAGETAPSLSQLLLSETAVKIALYLGAFFVVAAAFILAALIEVTRLPILAAFTLLFFAAAFGLLRRLPAASFVLFAVGGFMFPIGGGVLAGQLRLETEPNRLYWSAVWLLTGIVWVLGVRVYRSRLFGILAFACIFLAAFVLGLVLTPSEHRVLLLLTLIGLGGLLGAQTLLQWNGTKLFWPLFLTVQISQALILLVSLGVMLVDPDTMEPPWLTAGVLWGLATLFYVYSDRLVLDAGRWSPFALPAAFCAMLDPLLPLNAFSLDLHFITAAIWVWGALLAGLGEWLSRRSSPALRLYPPALFTAAGLLFVTAGVMESSDGSVALAVLYLLAAAGLYAGLSLRARRWGLWSAALVFGYMAYGMAQEFPFLLRLDLFAGYILLLPSVVLLALELALRRRGAVRAWWLPPLLIGLLSSFVLIWVTLVAGLDAHRQAAFAFAAFSMFLLGYAWLDRRPWVAYFSLGGLALALVYFMAWREVSQWAAPLIALAVAYDLVGLALAWRSRPPSLAAPPAPDADPLDGEESAVSAPARPHPAFSPWSSWAGVLQVSGLALGALVSSAAPLQSGPAVVALVAIVASLYALETYRRDSIWMGFPTVMLYFLAYAVALWELEIREPQFYSIAAALLGMVMYHLLARRRHHAAALVTGLLAQLILLSTTYIQMVQSDKFSFFFILFFQALALLAYGLVVRSRSFVVFPVIALVISVATVALTVLSGLPTVLIVGCTGLLLLMLGILALLLRERLVQATDRWVGNLEMP